MSEYLVYYRNGHGPSDQIRQILATAQQQGVVQMMDIDRVKQKIAEQGRTMPAWIRGIPLLAKNVPNGIPPHWMGTPALDQAKLIARNVHNYHQQPPPAQQHEQQQPQQQQYQQQQQQQYQQPNLQQQMGQRYQQPQMPSMGVTAEDGRPLSTSELYPISNRPKRGEPRALRDPTDDIASSGGSVSFSVHKRDQRDIVGFLAGKGETGKITPQQISHSMQGMPTGGYN